MADDMKQRHNRAARAFAARRGELGLSRAEVARRGPVAERTIHNFEKEGSWPHPDTLARLERAVNWPPGEIERRSDEPVPDVTVSDVLRAAVVTEVGPVLAPRIVEAIEDEIRIATSRGEAGAARRRGGSAAR
jgi:transcriptional regulator with XRE-family HTH domain